MARWIPTLTLNQKLGAAALALGAAATCAKVAPARTATVHATELLSAVARHEDQVAPAELAGWIVEGRADYRLVDLRDEKAYAAYHVPTAESLPLPQVVDGGLGRTEKIVLCDDAGAEAARAWLVLKGRGYTKALMLAGGVRAWKDEVLFPVKPQEPTGDEQAHFERAVQVARFFGGQPRGAAAGTETTASVAPAAAPVTAPTLAAPTLPAGAAVGAAPKKKKEGC